MKKILIVDDDPQLRERISKILSKEGYCTVVADNGRDAIEEASSQGFDIALLDLMMPKMTGMEVLQELKKIQKKIKIIMITAFATVGSAVDAMKKGASEYISKPFKIEELLVIIKRVLEEARFEQNVDKLELDYVMASLSNSIRRDIIKLIYRKTRMRFNEILRELKIEDNAKMAFHLRTLKDHAIIAQDEDKLYVLTDSGEKVLNSLRIMEKYISEM